MKYRIAVFVSILLIILTAPTEDVFATGDRDRLKKLRDRIHKEKEKIGKVVKQEHSILSSIEAIDKRLKEKDSELRSYNKKLLQAQRNIEDTNRRLNILEERLQEGKSKLIERLRTLYKQGKTGYYKAIFTSNDYPTILRNYKYMKILTDEDNRMLNRYRTDIEELNASKLMLERYKSDVLIYRNRLKKKKGEIKEERDKKELLLASIRSERSSSERLIKELEEASSRLERLLKESARKKDITPHYGKGFVSLKGKLLWPVDGKVVGFFGTQRDPEFNTKIFKQGIEIKAPSGNDIKAVAEGKVMYADWLKGYGMVIILSHGGGYYSVYAHASETYARVGEIITGNKVIGKIGDTGSLKGAGLYFEIRHNGEPLDPLVWLRKRQ
ncbi:MAG: peptidoglycan DD-metalloendopeptidase family protein [Nitrospirota bacterium]